MRNVIPNALWIGNARDSRNVKGVLALGISAVVDLAMEETPIVFPRDVIYCRFPLVDGSGNTITIIKAAIDMTVNFIRGNVRSLVTCSGGMSRSPAIVAAALAIVEDTSPQQSLDRIAATGPHDVSATFWAEVQQARESR